MSTFHALAGDRATERLLHQLGDAGQDRVHPLARPLLAACAVAVAAAIAWASWARVDEVTRGEGRVVPLSQIQKIQSLEGGLLEKLLVAEGDVVEAGQPLLQLDATRFQSAYAEAAAQADALRAMVARLEAETQQRPHVTFPSSVAAQPALVAAELSLFRARRERLQQTTAALAREIELARSQLRMLEPLVRSRAAPEMEALKQSQAIASLESKMAEIRTAYVQDAHSTLATKRAELAALENQLPQRQDQLRRTVVVSPVKGRVNDIRITTRGGVVQPGEPIMDVLPLEDELLVETKVRPRDVAFIAPGMEARVKITAYDYTVYGHLAGRVEQISADTIEEDTPQGKQWFYKVMVRTSTSHLERGGEQLPIKPGMVAEVDIRGDQRSVLSYLLRPLLKAQLR